MPAWLITWLISLAIKFGMAWLVKKFPWVPQSVVDVIDELINKLEDPTQSNSAAKKQAIVDIKECYGIGCSPNTKN